MSTRPDWQQDIGRGPTESATEIVEVTGREELAAAIQALPHDACVKIILHRKDKPMLFRYDFRKATAQSFRHIQGAKSTMLSQIIDEHLHRLAARIRKSSKELWL